MKYQDKVRQDNMKTESGRITTLLEDLIGPRVPTRSMIAIQKRMQFPGITLDKTYRVEESGALCLIWYKHPEDGIGRDAYKVTSNPIYSSFEEVEAMLDAQYWHII